MIPRGFVASLMVIALCGALPLLAGAAEGKLIPVRPAYAEAPADPEAPPTPSPKQQMYIFWLLGKMISFPIDKAESFVRGQIERPFFRPASSPAAENDPFASLDRGEVPPAPPITRRAGGR